LIRQDEAVVKSLAPGFRPPETDLDWMWLVRVMQSLYTFLPGIKAVNNRFPGIKPVIIRVTGVDDNPGLYGVLNPPTSPFNTELESIEVFLLITVKIRVYQRGAISLFP